MKNILKNIKNITYGTMSGQFRGIVKKTLKISIILLSIVAFVTTVFVPASAVLAAIPTLSVSSYGSNSQVQITVNGDQNQNVVLYYYSPAGSSNLLSAGTIGTTNSSGYFSTIVSSTSYNIPTGTNVFVIVNGQQSSTAVWPSTSGGNVYLSQSSITIAQQQTATVTISGGAGSGYYISTNTNSGIITTSISGNTLSVTATGYGSATLTICSSGSSVTCANLYVTVSGYSGGTTGSIYISPSTVVLNTGQSQGISISNSSYNQYNTYQSYYISNNTSPSSVSASISGSTLNVYGIAPGGSTITVCSGSGSYTVGCASVYVSVNAPVGYSGTYYSNNYNNQYYPYNYSYSYPTTYTYPQTYQQTYSYPVTYSYTPTYTSSVGKPVTGVFLNQVPSTGAGDNLKITLFILGLVLWSLFITYILHVKYGIGNVVAKATNGISGANGAHTASVNTKKDIALKFKLDQMKKKGII